MKKTEEKIKVMQAYLDNKQIEFDSGSRDVWVDWLSIEEPNWNWEDNEYRIKPEPRYRPFKDAEEAMDVIKEKGNIIKWDGDYFTILYICDGGVMIGGERVSRGYVQCLQYATFLDGTPFGVKEE